MISIINAPKVRITEVIEEEKMEQNLAQKRFEIYSTKFLWSGRGLEIDNILKEGGLYRRYVQNINKIVIKL